MKKKDFSEESNYYNIEQINEYTYRFSCGMGVYFDLFTGSERALLFDTGYGFGNLKKTVEKITDKPLAIINSHGHLDHTGGNFLFTDCDIYMHESEKKIYMMHNTPEMRARNLKYAKKTKIKKNSSVEILPDNFDSDAYLDISLSGCKKVDEGYVFNLGGIELETYNFKGHTNGGIALLDKSSKSLYTGDAISPFVWLFLDESTPLSAYIDSLKRAMDINFKDLYMGHGSTPAEKKALQYYLDTAENLDYKKGHAFKAPRGIHKEVRLCVRQGYTKHDIKKEGFAAIAISEDKLK